MDFLRLAEAMFPVDKETNHAETCPGSLAKVWLVVFQVLSPKSLFIRV
jgi:hypothetical protein